jgi:tape measure domain-containing protein
MSNGALNYKLGGDASGLQAAFATSLRFAGTFSENLRKTLSVRGIFEGIGQQAIEALGGKNLGELFAKAFKGATGGEQIQQQFEGLTGSTQSARAFIKELTEYASDANFSRQQLLDVAAKTVGPDGTGLMNAERFLDSLRLVGDVARGSSGSVEDLMAVFSRAFVSGQVGAKELSELLRNAPAAYKALADELGADKEKMEQLVQQGRIGFPQLEAAFRRVTAAGGAFGGAVDKYKNTLGAILDDARETIGKIPTAFFSGIIESNFGAAKEGAKEVRAMLQGWVENAKQFGRWVAAAVQTARDMFAEGGWAKIGPLIGDALMAAVGGAVTLLVRGFTMAAMSLGQALAGIFSDLGSVISGKISAIFGGEDNGPSAGKMAENFTKNLIIGAGEGRKLTAGLDYGKDARASLSKAFAPGMAAQLLPGRINESFLKMLPGFLKGGANGLGAPNLPGVQRVQEADGKAAKFQTDRLSSIGLYVGAGGPQAEAHAKSTAKHTQTTAKAAQRIADNTAGLPGLAPGKFGGRNR